MNSLEKVRKRYYYTGMAGYFLSGICAISNGIIISLLQDQYGFSYGYMGTMVSAMSVGNMLSILTAGVLPGIIGERSTTLILGSGYFLGYLLIAADHYGLRAGMMVILVPAAGVVLISLFMHRRQRERLVS